MFAKLEQKALVLNSQDATSSAAFGPTFKVNPAEELERIKSEYGDPVRSDCRVAMKWDGSELVLTLENLDGSNRKEIRQKLDLPKGISLEIIDGCIIKLEDKEGKIFFEKGSGAPASYLDLLGDPTDVYAAAHLFIVSLPYEINGVWYPNIYLKRYLYMPELDTTSLHSSGVDCQDIQTFLNGTLRYMLEQADLVRSETSIDVAGGKVKVFGPTRYGEVLLTTGLSKGNAAHPSHIFCNPQSGELRISDLWLSNLRVISGDFSSGEFKFELTNIGEAPARVYTYDLTLLAGNEPLKACELRRL